MQNCLLSTSLRAGVAIIALVSLSSQAQAAGFFIQEQSTSAAGSAYAGAASHIKDASTVFFNPAGMTSLDAAQFQLGTQLLVPKSEMTNTGSTRTFFNGVTLVSGPAGGGDGGNPYSATPVPSGFVAIPVTSVDGLWLGLGVTAPFGLENKYDSGWFGRFDSTETTLLTTDIQPSVAYKVNDWLSIGGGLNFQRAYANLQSATSNAVSEGTTTLEGDDWGYGYTLGLQVKPTPDTTLGANYRSSVHYDLDGKFTVAGLVAAGPFPAPNGVTRAKASLTTPDIASFGISQKMGEKWTVMGQANWYGWNSFGAITPISDAGTQIASIEQGYQTVWAYAVGAEYIYSPDWTLRAGIQYDNTPTTDTFRTTRTPDGDRTWLSAGATYNLTPKLSLDMAATYIHIADEEINVLRGTATIPQRIRAETEGQVGILAVGLNYKF